jgi:hypothetical protein
MDRVQLQLQARDTCDSVRMRRLPSRSRPASTAEMPSIIRAATAGWLSIRPSSASRESTPS